MTQVVLIRPGATVYDEQHRVQGCLDLPLCDKGRAEAAELAERLAAIPSTEFAALYCGPSQNAIKTGEIVGRALGLRPKRIDDLRNLDQGLWQGLQIEEIRHRHQSVFRHWLDDPFSVQPPQGETAEEAIERVHAALKPLIRKHKDETIGLVACEPIARLIAAQLRREACLQFHDLTELESAGFERIDVPSDWGRNGDGG